MTTPNPFAAPEPGAWQPDGPASGADQPSATSSPPGYGPPTAYGQQPYAPPGYGPPPYAAAPGYGFGPPAATRTNGLAIAALVLGCLWLLWLGSILALVFGYVAKSQIQQSGEQGGGLATAGIVLGWVGIGFLVLLLGLFVVGAGTTGVEYEQYSDVSSLAGR